MQLTLSVSAFLALVASTLALQVTAPAERSNLDLSTDNTISWTSVSSDPSSFNIILTNMAVNPSVSITIASDVQTSDGSYDFSGIEGVTPGANYQINLVGTSNSNQGILAQSGQFDVTDAGSSSTTSASFTGSTASTSAMTSTSTVTSTTSTSGSMTTITSTGTSTTTGTASSSASGSSSSESASGSASGSSAAAASATGGASSLNTFAGAGVLAMVAALLA